MEFSANKPIYLQIVEYCFRQILTGVWIEEGRILSVRELAALLQVNPNTVMRSFDYLQSENVIYMKRGMGYYVQKNAVKTIRKIQKEEFFKEILPDIFQKMDLLDISMEDIELRYNQAKTKNEI